MPFRTACSSRCSCWGDFRRALVGGIFKRLECVTRFERHPPSGGPAAKRVGGGALDRSVFVPAQIQCTVKAMDAGWLAYSREGIVVHSVDCRLDKCQRPTDPAVMYNTNHEKSTQMLMCFPCGSVAQAISVVDWLSS